MIEYEDSVKKYVKEIDITIYLFFLLVSESVLKYFIYATIISKGGENHVSRKLWHPKSRHPHPRSSSHRIAIQPISCPQTTKKHSPTYHLSNHGRMHQSLQ